ncbi:Chitinase [hydrothermal vent metagenome]|uniref:Chitinase n=1 Tax=hydrothermal vent metagenome TaxID=652676 RepID=A0A3B0ZIF5_9ZZZZ
MGIVPNHFFLPMPVLILCTASILSACGGGGEDSFSIGGVVEGLSGSIILQNNGGDNFTTAENGAFEFSKTLSNTSDYLASILSKPAAQDCTISHAAGTVSDAAVTDIVVSCEDIPSTAPTPTPTNIAPTANAGSNFSVFEHDPVSLVGNGVDSDGTIATYAWSQTAGPNIKLIQADTPTSNFTAPTVSQNTDLLFQLTVTDNDNASSFAVVTVTVKPKPTNAPKANAGPDQSVDEETVVTLLGSGSDSDGTIISSTWRQTTGPNVALANTTALNTTFTSPTVTETTQLVFELVVTDNDNLTASDFIIIAVHAVNIPPTVKAGNLKNVEAQATVNLLGSANDSDGNIVSYLWRQTSGPNVSLTDANKAKATFIAPTVSQETKLTFELTVRDNENATASAFVNINVAALNHPPIVNAGTNRSVDKQTNVTLVGNAEDSDGNIVAYLWRQIIGPDVNLVDANSAVARFSAPNVDQNTDLIFEFTATDNGNSAVSDTVTITVVSTINSPPTIKAGDDIRIQEQGQVTLTSFANDPNGGEIISYQWQQTKGPTVTLDNANRADTSFTAPKVSQRTVLEFTVTVTDNDNTTATDTINIIVFNSAARFKVTGNVTFDLVPHGANFGLNYSATTAAPVRGAIIEAIDTDKSEAVAASTTTDTNGNYRLNLLINKNYFIRVKAQLKKTGTSSWDFSVVDNSSGNALYALVGSKFNVGVKDSTRDMHAPSGWDGSSYSSARSAAPFAILNTVYSAYNKILVAQPDTKFPALKLKWSVNNGTANGGTSYYDGDSIYLLGAADDDTDEYDQHVILHEWMHYYTRKLSRDDSMGGSHTLRDILDIRHAYSEGLATAFSAMVTDQPLYSDSIGIQQSSGFTIDMEDEELSNPGWYNQRSVALTLYDIYDSNNESGDNLTLGIKAINDVLTTAMRSAPITSIFPFITALRSNNTNVASAIDALFMAQSINSNSDIDPYGTNETNHPGDPTNILPIFTPLIVDDPAINICSIADFGTYNKLSNRRFIRFHIASEGTYQIKVSGSSTSDPDFILYGNGDVSFSGVSGTNETFSPLLIQGDYILEVYEYTNVYPGNGSSGALGTTCFDISINII